MLPPTTLALVCIALLAPSRGQQGASEPSLDRLVDPLMYDVLEKRHIPGAAVAVMRDGALVLAKGYGYANLEHDVPVEPETIFQSGSTGKQFTATLPKLAPAGRR